MSKDILHLFLEVLRHSSVIQFINFTNTWSTYMSHSRFTLHALDNRDLRDMIWVCIELNSLINEFYENGRCY